MHTTLSLTWDDLSVGQHFESPTRTVTESDVMLFAGLTGDHAEHHTSRTVAESGPFGKPVAHGLLVLSIAHGLMLGSGLLRGSVEAVIGVSDWRFVAPVMFGDTVGVRFVVASMRPSKSKPGNGILVFDVEVVNQEGHVLQKGSKAFLMSTTPTADSSADTEVHVTGVGA